ncbi:MAG TPA: hydantoinase/oxoprolinase family protein [Gemmatimonadales bacterium]|nr:hydantoinase/oxoprolinase family protein [Gemmatimonadales bacterium]
MTPPSAVVGWDIGGVNTKVVRLESGPNGPVQRSASLPFEIKYDPAALVTTMRQAARSIGGGAEDLHAVTMTAELSQAFRTKREGVGFILDALNAAFPDSRFHIYDVAGSFVGPAKARELPLAVAAANWSATAAWLARSTPTAILIDIGTTSADLIPIVNGRVVAQGRTDPERLLSGELVYTGTLRTPVEAVAHRVPLWGGIAGVAGDGFAIMGDVYLWLGQLRPEDYSCPTPDGGPLTRQSAGERLARVVCGDRDMLDEAAVDAIAETLASAQREMLAGSIARILDRWPLIDGVVVAGLGDFIGAEAARTLGLRIIPPPPALGQPARHAPAAAVAWLLWDSLQPSL